MYKNIREYAKKYQKKDIDSGSESARSLDPENEQSDEVYENDDSENEEEEK